MSDSPNQKVPNDREVAENHDVTNLSQNACRFVDRVSHEFRTPLTVLKKYSTLLRDGIAGALNDQQREMVDVLHDRANDLTLMFDAMLDLGRLDAGLFRIWRRPCRLDEILETVRRGVHEKATLRKITLETRVHNADQTVWCDRDKLTKALTGLLAFLIRYSEDGTSIWVEADLQDASGSKQWFVRIGSRQTCFEETTLDSVRALFERETAEGDSADCGIWEMVLVARLVQMHYGHIRPVDLEKGALAFELILPTGEPVDLIRRWRSRFASTAMKPAKVGLIDVVMREDFPGKADGVVDEFLQRTVGVEDLILRAGSNRWRVLVDPSQNAEGTSETIGRIRAGWQETLAEHPGGILPELDCQSIGQMAFPDEGSESTLLEEK